MSPRTLPFWLSLPLAFAASAAVPEGDGWEIRFSDDTERFAIETARYGVHPQDSGETEVTFRVDANGRIDEAPRQEGAPTEPFWELTVMLAKGTAFAPKAGDAFAIAQGLDEARNEYVVDFYYHEHEVSDGNRIEILSVDGQRLRARITGHAWEPKRDGSRTPIPMTVEAWFEADAKTLRSSS
jgi:hypothetical protein